MMNSYGTGLMPKLRRYCYPLYFLRKMGEELTLCDRVRRPLSERDGLEDLRRSDFAREDRSTAFILASGSSVNDFTPAQWEEIQEGFSIGLNWWLLHDFVPDAYSLELPDLEAELGRAASTKRDVMLELLQLRAQDYRDALVWVRGRHQMETLLQVGVPEPVRQRLRLATCLHLPGETWSEVARASRVARFWLMLARRLGYPDRLVLPGLSSSILYLTLLCYALGFQRIVLCGVDLNNSFYFFDEPDDRTRRTREGWPHPNLGTGGQKHLTQTRAVSVTDRFEMFQPLFGSSGPQLYSGSAQSALVPTFPAYPWRGGSGSVIKASTALERSVER